MTLSLQGFHLAARSGLAFVLALSLSVLILGLSLLPAAAQSAAEPYRVGAGDVLAVMVYGETGLSGEFTVSPDGTIAYPILGNVPVAGLTSAEIAERVDKALADYVPAPAVTATVARYAPVFIVGDVERPGRYEYRPGMTALELVALGGGVRRTPADGGAWLVAARQEYTDLELQIFAQQVRRARLKAELDGTAFDYPPPAEPDPDMRDVKQRLVEGERVLFEVRQATLASEDEALAAQERSYADEIEQLAASIKLHDEEIKLLEQDVLSTRDLAERGLTAKSNLREMERRLSSARRDALEMRSFLARATQNRLALDQRRVALVETLRREAAQEMQEIDTALARMRARRSVLFEAISEAMLRGNPEEARPRLTFSIVSAASDGFGEVPAGELTLLRPGDILRATLVTGAAPAALAQRETAATGTSSIARQR